MRLLVAIPALNEEATITSVIRDVKSKIPHAHILVIDDGSTDNTRERARAEGAQVISLPFNLGVGGALRAAFKYALENKYDFLLQIDADGQHIASEASKLISKATDNSIVIGSRFLSRNYKYEVSFARNAAMRLLALITSKITRTKLTDVTSGFRITSRNVFHLFAKEYPRDYLGDTVESLVIAHRNGFKISEVPVNMNQRLHGIPSQNFLRSLWYLGRALLVIILTVLRKKSDE